MAVPRGFPGIGIQARRDIDRYHGFLERIEVVDHFTIITPDLRIEPRAEDPINDEVKLFQISFDLLVFRIGREWR